MNKINLLLTNKELTREERIALMWQLMGYQQTEDL